MKLYNITESDVEDVPQDCDSDSVKESDRYVVTKLLPGKFGAKPLKVVYVLEEGTPVIVSTYPVKKSYRGQTL